MIFVDDAGFARACHTATAHRCRSGYLQGKVDHSPWNDVTVCCQHISCIA